MTTSKKDAGRLATAVLAAALAAGGTVFEAAAFTRHGYWSSYTERADGNDLCFAASRPVRRDPRGGRRDSAYVYVAVSPGGSVDGEVSLKLGFPLKHASEVVVTIGTARYRLFAHGERAFVADRATEKHLLELMRRSTRMVVQSTAERGGQVHDTYSLVGLNEALQSTTAGCR